MKVRLGTIEIDDEERRAIRAYYGQRGLATRADVRAFFIAMAEADLETIVHDFAEERQRGEEREQ